MGAIAAAAADLALACTWATAFWLAAAAAADEEAACWADHAASAAALLEAAAAAAEVDDAYARSAAALDEEDAAAAAAATSTALGAGVVADEEAAWTGVMGMPLGFEARGRATRGATGAAAGDAATRARLEVLVVELGRRLEEVLRKW